MSPREAAGIPVRAAGTFSSPEDMEARAHHSPDTPWTSRLLNPLGWYPTKCHRDSLNQPYALYHGSHCPCSLCVPLTHFYQVDTKSGETD